MDYIFICKHCQEPFVVSVNDFNCRILRHGVYKHNMQHIPPHGSKDECDALVRDDLIFGCGRPLQIIDNVTNSQKQTYDVVICDYI
jgi:hypothetical protein